MAERAAAEFGARGASLQRPFPCASARLLPARRTSGMWVFTRPSPQAWSKISRGYSMLLSYLRGDALVRPTARACDKRTASECGSRLALRARTRRPSEP